MGGLDCSATRFLNADQQGSIIATSDCGANAINLNRYDDWGNPDAFNWGRFQYTGQAWLGEIGLYYYKARIYNPRLGRFLQVDPVGYDDQINLYAYVGNDSVNAKDPDGTFGTFFAINFQVSSEATRHSNDPAAGAKATAQMNLKAASNAAFVAGGVEGAVAKNAVRTALTAAGTSGGVSAVVGKVQGDSPTSAGLKGMVSGAATALSPGGIANRIGNAIAIANGSFVSTKATGGSNLEAGAAAVAGGVVELATGVEPAAATAGQATASALKIVTISTVKDVVNSAIAGSIRAGCKAFTNDKKC